MLERANQLHGTHFGLADELLIPAMNHCDASRVNMFSGHFVQSTTLNKSEPPLFNSSFENSIGKYSSAFFDAEEDMLIEDIFMVNENTYMYKFRLLASRKTLIYQMDACKHLTEKYGYLYDHSKLKEFKVNDIIPKGTRLRSWPCSDEYGNLQYGLNLRTRYSFYKGLTYEDAIVMSESTAKAFSHTVLTLVDVMINLNDVLVMFYKEGKSFPDINEHIQNNILAAVRRIDHSNISSLSDGSLKNIQFEYDTAYYAKGKVMDIQAFSNIPIEKLEHNEIYSQILKYVRQTEDKATWFKSACMGIDSNPEQFIGDSGFLYRRNTDNGKWVYNDSEFEGVLLRFVVAEDSPIVKGSKITNRMGGKGIVSAILPDEEMDGCDIICNAGGIWARMNLGQLYEHDITSACSEIVERMRSFNNVEEAGKLYYDFITYITTERNKNFLDRLIKRNPAQFLELVEEIMETGDIYVEFPPMFNGLPMRKLYTMFKDFNLRPEGVTPPVGRVYYMKLRHEPSSKFSARSASHLSVTGMPTKNNRDVKNYTAPYSTTAIRVGEQELENLFLTPHLDRLDDFIKIMATDEAARESYIRKTLTEAPLPKKLDIKTSVSKATLGLNSFLNGIGLDLNFSDKENKGKEDE